MVTRVVTSENGKNKPFSYDLLPLVPLILKNTLHMKRFFVKTAKNHSKKLVCIFAQVVTECGPQGKWLEIKPFCCYHSQSRRVVVMVDGGKYKDMIAGRMRKPNGRGSWMVYNDCDREYAEQVTAEHKVNVKSANGTVTQKWELKRSHADNHYLDCEVYGMAAADILGVRTLHLEQLERQPQTTKPEKQEQYTPEESWINTNERWI